MSAGDIGQKWLASTALTISLASLATDANLLAGRASTAVDPTAAANVVDYLLSGKITTGTGPTADKFIEVWVYAAFDDTPIYPDGITGTDANKTMTSANVKMAALARAALIKTDNTSDRTYYLRPVSIKALFGRLPHRWGAFVVHNTGAALNATAANHALVAKPVYEAVAQA